MSESFRKIVQIVFELRARSLAVLCMQCKIRCNPMHPLHGALPEPYVSVRVTLGAVITHPYTYAHHRCRTSQYHRIFYSHVSISVEESWWPHIWWCATGRFQEEGLCFFIGLTAGPLFVSHSFPFLIFLGWYCGADVFGLIGCWLLSLSLAQPTFFNNNNNNHHQYLHRSKACPSLCWTGQSQYLPNR